jgi:hypothetical protein
MVHVVKSADSDAGNPTDLIPETVVTSHPNSPRSC